MHVHQGGQLALLALEKNALCPDCETGGISVVDIRDPTHPQLLAQAPSSLHGGRIYTASWAPGDGHYLVSFSAMNETAFVYQFVMAGP